jgi:hypothetical protein
MSDHMRDAWLANPKDLHYRGELMELGVRVTDALEQSMIARTEYTMKDLDQSDYEADGKRCEQEMVETNLDLISQELFRKPYDKLSDKQAGEVLDVYDERYPED